MMETKITHNILKYCSNIKNNHYFYFYNPLDPSKNTGSFAKEIKYMQDRGYKVSPDGTTLIREVSK